MFCCLSSIFKDNLHIGYVAQGKPDMTLVIHVLDPRAQVYLEHFKVALLVKS